MKVTYGTMSFLYTFGTTEDGEDYIGTMTHVVASMADGRRFIKADVAFPSCRRFDSEEGVRSFEDLREQAEEQAHKLAQSLKNTVFDINDWEETTSAYGSAAHCEQDLIDFENTDNK